MLSEEAPCPPAGLAGIDDLGMGRHPADRPMLEAGRVRLGYEINVVWGFEVWHSVAPAGICVAPGGYTSVPEVVLRGTVPIANGA